MAISDEQVGRRLTDAQVWVNEAYPELLDLDKVAHRELMLGEQLNS